MFTDVGLSEVRQEGRRRRRECFVAALAATGVAQAEVARRMNLDGHKTAPTTVNRWFTGTANLDEDTLTYVLQLLGLPATWKPGDELPKPTPPPPTTH